jgi:hypothetical protein
LRKREKQVLTVKAILAISGIFFLLIYGIERFNQDRPASLPFFWLQLLTGSAWPEWKETGTFPHVVWFAVGATVQIMVAAGPLIGFIWLAIETANERRKLMRLPDLLKVRDAELKFLLLEMIREKYSDEEAIALAPMVDRVFARSDERWKRELELVLGEDDARDFLAELESQAR